MMRAVLILLALFVLPASVRAWTCDDHCRVVQRALFEHAPSARHICTERMIYGAYYMRNCGGQVIEASRYGWSRTWWRR